MDNPIFDSCGIEVSAKTLLVRRSQGEKSLSDQTFANTSAGHHSLIRFLRPQGRPVRICMESTGTYGLDLALALSGVEGLELTVANPRAVRRFAQALQVRGKTDRLDVGVLQEFARRMPQERWFPPTLACLQLRALARRLEDLAQQRTIEKNRRHALSVTLSTPEILQRQLQLAVERLEQDSQEILGEALRLIEQEAALQRQYQLLLTIKGVGKLSAVQILAELAVLGDDRTAKQWVAFAGLDPKPCQSGSSVDRKACLSKAGCAHLRRALYMPALVAANHDPQVRNFYNHLLQRGKLPLQALCAIMRKLLHAIHAMIRTAQPFDSQRLFAPNLHTNTKSLSPEPTATPIPPSPPEITILSSP